MAVWWIMINFITIYQATWTSIISMRGKLKKNRIYIFIEFSSVIFELEKVFFLLLFLLEHEVGEGIWSIECSFFTQQNYNALNHRFHRLWHVMGKAEEGEWKESQLAKSGVKNRLGDSCFGFVINSLSPIYLLLPFIRFGASSFPFYALLLLWKVFILIYICYIIIPIIFLVKKSWKSSSSSAVSFSTQEGQQPQTFLSPNCYCWKWNLIISLPSWPVSFISRGVFSDAPPRPPPL